MFSILKVNLALQELEADSVAKCLACVHLQYLVILIASYCDFQDDLSVSFCLRLDDVGGKEANGRIPPAIGRGNGSTVAALRLHCDYCDW